MTSTAILSGIIPPDVAGVIPSRSALDLAQALVHDAETRSRQGYHGLLVTLDVDSAYPSVQPQLLRGPNGPRMALKHLRGGNDLLREAPLLL